ncbi:unnamed protein product [Arabidopsis lyrata]|uniref:Uncharacterized protein n=1 Tax=Arabidopsis lyrata subsp. lyrata TaxID=81972 RepID=D7KHD5_ARALL|nr:UPF0725 protein At2g20620 [Arabidopsis lyrata subsp. lyrata]EFH66592.1 hypothetical protein ARALYDRAFT_889373 [Arabidopsis lyrata subsp. lyrata]CAH8252841.1 unnamed protein product [Arabidopsis lyrata]|eukprot:XP_002890333.1 UPF0725 protein At2g20620 [Arabidopsis lyrata subsp. lyrata]
MFLGEGTNDRAYGRKGFIIFPDPPYPYEPKRIGALYYEDEGDPDVYFVPPVEEYEPSLPSSQSPTDSCHEQPDSPTYEPMAPGELPECDVYKDICSDPQKVDWAVPPMEFLAEVGLGCYNLQKGTNFQFSDDPHDFQYLYHTGFEDLTDFEDHTDAKASHSLIMRNSTCEFETRAAVQKDEEEDCSLSLITTLHRPQTPEVEGDTLAPDDFFKGPMPDRLPHDRWRLGNMLNNPKFYLLRKSEMEEHKELFLLYAEITLFSHWESIRLMEWAKPLELLYVIVQTREPNLKLKAKAENANFYITFSTCHGFPFHAVIRRTTTGKPNQMSLEFKMLMC